MPIPEFRPGFRISTRDALVVVLGAIGSSLIWPKVWWLGFTIAFGVGHFFLFCNVFRIARAQELAWTAIFLILVRSTAATGRPSWTATILLSLAATIVAVGIELRKPSYHGVGWSRVNPGLRRWWDTSLE